MGARRRNQHDYPANGSTTALGTGADDLRPTNEGVKSVKAAFEASRGTYTPAMWPVRLSARAGVRTHSGVPAVVLTLAGCAVGIIVTALILGTPYLAFGYHSPSGHLVLDSIDACVALLVAYLVHGRFLRRRRLQDMLLAQGLVLLAVAGLGLNFAAGLVHGYRPGTLDVWLPLTVRVTGAVLIAAAAVANERPAKRSGWQRLPIVGPVAVIGVMFLVLWNQRSGLPVALDPTESPVSAQEPFITGHPVLLVGQGITGVCFIIASIAFTAQAVRRDDELLQWLGPACALGAFARVNYVLFPSLYTDWLYTGDLLRTGCYLLLLVGAAREIGQYWTAQAQATVLEDRRRLARELHDGVIQELGYIRSESHAIPADGGRADRIIDACDRALDEARAAVQALGHSGHEHWGFVLQSAARQVADRYDAQLELDLDDSVSAEPDQQYALIRITREAVSNAARHGGATQVRVQLYQDGNGRRLVIEDDGQGFDAAATVANSTGYGLTTMRERAHALPGTFSIEAEQGKGSVVTVAW